MIKKTLSFLLVVILILSCNESGTDPETAQANPREYTWTIDTISYPRAFQTILFSVWGKSPDDVYACGHSSVGSGNLWHYDGTEWSDIEIKYEVPYGLYSLRSVFGTDETNIWIGGSKIEANPNPPPSDIDIPFLANTNGYAWFSFLLEPLGQVESIHGTDFNNMWAITDSCDVLHFDGTTWEIDRLEFDLPEGGCLQVRDIVYFNSTTYILAYYVDISTSSATFFFIGGRISNWQILNSCTITTGDIIYVYDWGDNSFFSSPWGTLYSIGQGGFYQFDNVSSWSPAIPSATYLVDIFGIDGLSENNIIMAGSDYAYHWNGVDLYLIPELTNTDIQYNGVVMFDKEVFLVGYLFDGSHNSVIAHGRKVEEVTKE